MIKWITDNSAFIVTVSTVLTAVITVMYVIFTYRLIHTPYKSIVKIKSMDFGRGLHEYILVLKNVGLHASHDISIKYTGFGQSKKKELDGWYEQVFKNNSVSDIGSNEEIRINIEKVIRRKTPFIISWRTLTNKTHRGYYVYDMNYTYEVRKQSLVERVLFFFWFIIVDATSLFHKFKTIIYYKGSGFKVGIIKTIYVNEKQNVDELKETISEDEWGILLTTLHNLEIQGYILECERFNYSVTERGVNKYSKYLTDRP